MDKFTCNIHMHHLCCVHFGVILDWTWFIFLQLNILWSSYGWIESSTLTFNDFDYSPEYLRKVQFLHIRWLFSIKIFFQSTIVYHLHQRKFYLINNMACMFIGWWSSRWTIMVGSRTLCGGYQAIGRQVRLQGISPLGFNRKLPSWAQAP
jgi:hypothetical protein